MLRGVTRLIALVHASNTEQRSSPSNQEVYKFAIPGVRFLKKITDADVVSDSDEEKELSSDALLFIKEYSKRESLHWNLDKLKEIELPKIKEYSLTMDEMLSIVDNLLSTEDDIKETIKDYIRRLHDVEDVITKVRWPRIDREYFPTLKIQLGSILKHFDQFSDSRDKDMAKKNLFSLSNSIKNTCYGHIEAIRDACALINGNYKPRINSLFGLVKHRIALLKDSRFRLLVTPCYSSQNTHIHVLNYWVVRMMYVLGFRVNLGIQIEYAVCNDPFQGRSHTVLKSFLDDVFTPGKIIDILTTDINDDRMMMATLLSFLMKDETLSNEQKEKLLSEASSREGIKRNVVQDILIKMNLLIRNNNSVEN